LRLVGHTFFALPGCQQVLVNSYQGRSDQPGTRQTILSARITRDSWSKVKAEPVDSLDVVAAFRLFETRHKVMEGDRLGPVEPLVR
jgi:hypothetical protein